MDIPTYYHGFQTVVKIKEDDKEMMFLTSPGHLGITGMNSKIVSINCNTFMQLDYARTGLYNFASLYYDHQSKILQLINTFLQLKR